jgi:bacillopeptidase F (M6 metalloprotease family)
MKTVKIMIAALLIAASFCQAANAQDKQKSETKSTTSVTKLKDHKCNAKCNAAAHNYVHGEKGHVCTDACKKTTKKA